MAAVRTPTEKALNRFAIVAVLIITMIFLAPIYWIVATSFKPRNLATTIPPTVVFTPEISPFVKLFTKRSQLRSEPTPEEYAAAPWWERMVFDGGEKIVLMPTLGGSVPMYLFVETFRVPVVGLPIVNHDNSQHAPDENLRLQNLWDGIATFAVTIGGLGQGW